MSAEYRGLNLTRRRARCEACSEVFFTIEVPEPDFQHLRRKPGRLEVPAAQIRPREVK